MVSCTPVGNRRKRRVTNPPVEFLHFVEKFRSVNALIWWGRRVRLPGLTVPEYRRRLPHFHPDDAYLFLTWRLWGSFPSVTDSTVYRSAGHAFVAQDRTLDRR